MLSTEFLYAGRALFTVSNPDGKQYTFKVSQKDEKSPHFVSLLTGPQNTSDYTYLGALFNKAPKVTITTASRYKADSLPVKVLNWALGVISQSKPIPSGYKIQHEGKCGACGRLLTDAVSIETGLGPICRNK